MNALSSISPEVRLHEAGKQAVAERPLFSVCTPSYNRALLLPRVFEGLKAQTCQDFEWLIIDDGSSDGTEAVVEGWDKLVSFPIRYIRKENGGKHTALNRAIQEARGVLFAVVDSDDWLLPEGLARLRNRWEEIKDQPGFAGACGLFQYTDGSVVGTRFPGETVVSNAIDLRLSLGVKGDKIGFTRMDIMRQFTFPEHFGRFYVPESIVWNRIAQQFDTLFFNEVIGVKEYQPEGITDRAALNSVRNPGAYFTRAAELLGGRRRIPFRSAVRCAITLSKCAIYSNRNPFAGQRIGRKLLIAAVFPLAVILLLRDRLRARRAAAKA